MMESIEKLRLWSHSHDSEWLQDNGDVVFTTAASHAGINYGEYIRGLVDEIEREISERYMELPVDADGVPIHLRDKLLCDDTGEAFIVSGYESELPDGEGVLMPAGDDRDAAYYPKTLRHVKPRTIEDVLREFAEKCAEGSLVYTESDVAKYADEIRGML